MIRRTDTDLYAIPGGAQEIGETISQTVVREVKEETGVDVEVTGLIGIYSDPNHVSAFSDGFMSLACYLSVVRAVSRSADALLTDRSLWCVLCRR